MELEKLITLPAPPDKVWALLLDPEVMGACVPGMQAIEVLGPTEYRAVMQVKMAFISAKFKIRTTVVEQRPPHYLKSEGVGDDASVASSFKQTSEIFLDDDGSGGTAPALAARGRTDRPPGSFGLSAMKTKADRLWDEFGVNLSQRLRRRPPSPWRCPLRQSRARAAARCRRACRHPRRAVGRSKPAGERPGACRAVVVAALVRPARCDPRRRAARRSRIELTWLAQHRPSAWPGCARSV